LRCAIVDLIALQEQGTVREVHARNEVFGSVDGNFAAGHNCDKDQRDYVDDDYEFTHMIFTEFVVVTRKMAIMLTSVFPPSIVQALMSHGTATFYLIAVSHVLCRLTYCTCF